MAHQKILKEKEERTERENITFLAFDYDFDWLFYTHVYARLRFEFQGVIYINEKS